MAGEVYRPRPALTILIPAAAVFVLSVLSGGFFVVVLVLAVVVGLGSLLLPDRARLVGCGLLLGCAVVLVVCAANYE